MFLFDVFIANYIYILEKIKKILKYRLDFCKIMLKSIVGSLRRMGRPRFPPYASRRNADCMSPTLRASPWGEVPSLSRRRGDSLTFRYSHFYRLHTSLYLNTSSIRLNSYAYKLLSPLSRPAGASSPQGEPLLTLTSIHLVSTRRVSLLPKVNSSCLHTKNLSYTHPNAISKSNSDLPHKERSLQIIAKI